MSKTMPEKTKVFIYILAGSSYVAFWGLFWPDGL